MPGKGVCISRCKALTRGGTGLEKPGGAGVEKVISDELAIPCTQRADMCSGLDKVPLLSARHLAKVSSTVRPRKGRLSKPWEKNLEGMLHCTEAKLRWAKH